MKLCTSLWHFNSENGDISCDRPDWDFFNYLKSIEILGCPGLAFLLLIKYLEVGV